MRMACDTGGTFTDLVVEARRRLRLFKALDDAGRPGRRRARRARRWPRADYGLDRAALPRRAATLHPRHDARDQRDPHRQHGAHRVPDHRRAIRDILLFREGGRIEPFNFTRRLPGALRAARADLRGARADRRRRARSCKPLDEAACSTVVERLRTRERRGGRRLPAVVDRQPGARAARRRAARASTCRACRSRSRTELNPTLREYRRASSTCIDASLKPLMTDYLARARRAGCARPASRGRLLMVTSQRRRARRRRRRRRRRSTRSTPGPAMAPVAGRLLRRAAMPAADDADRRRHRRHQLRRQPRARRPHPLDARDLARPAATSAT